MSTTPNPTATAERTPAGPPSLVELLSAFGRAVADRQAEEYAERAYGFALVELAIGHTDCAESALSAVSDDRLVKLPAAACALSQLAAEILIARGLEFPTPAGEAPEAAPSVDTPLAHA
jgi:hypothetical protein